VDWAIVFLVLAFAVRGFARGTVSQVCGLVGVVAGLWAAGWVSQWVGEQWRDARPTVAFWILRWMVVGFSGLAVATLFQWWGDLLGSLVRQGPVGWIDRPFGLVVGSVMGLMVAAFVLLLALLGPWPRALAGGVAGARTARPLMAGAARVCAAGGRYFPGSIWLSERFLMAERRARSRAISS